MSGETVSWGAASRKRDRARSLRAAGWALLASIAGAEALFAQGSPDRAEPEAPAITIEMLDQMSRLPGDLGPLPPVPVPVDNPQSAAKVELGRKLFFDNQLQSEKASDLRQTDPRYRPIIFR